MHHLVFGINFHVHFVSLVSLISIHLLIHLSTQFSLIIPALIIHHSFTLSLQAQNLPFQQSQLYFYPLDCFHDRPWDSDWTYHVHQFIFVLFVSFIFFVYSVW